MKILQKISWKVRKLHITISPLIIYINSNWEGWGFDLFTISKNLNEYSLLKLNWHLPNGADRKLKFTGDFLFLRTTLLKKLENLLETELWTSSRMTKFDKLKLTILKFIFG